MGDRVQLGQILSGYQKGGVGVGVSRRWEGRVVVDGQSVNKRWQRKGGKEYKVKVGGWSKLV